MSSTKSSSSSAKASTTRLSVPPESEGHRLDRVLGNHPDMVSREMARRLILDGEVHLNGQPGAPATRVKAGDEITFHVPPAQPLAVPAEPYPLDILREDSALIVIHKPAGMPMHPGPGHRTGTLVNHLLAHCSDLSGIGGVLRPGIVHRLDKDTSGVVVSAKSDHAHLHLAAQFKARTIHRTYLALATGRPPQKRGTIDLPLDRQRSNRMRRAVDPAGKRAVTHWEVLKRLGPFTLFKLKLETGRTHQIRVHLAHRGWPLLGDPLYGEKRHRGLALPPELAAPLEALQGQALHAAELGFLHPDNEATLHFTAPLPERIASVLALLETAYGDPEG